MSVCVICPAKTFRKWFVDNDLWISQLFKLSTDFLEVDYLDLVAFEKLYAWFYP